MAEHPDFSIEDGCDGTIVFGADEAGRGPLAGPVVAAAVYISPEQRGHPVWKDVRDSKKLSAVKRDVLFPVIQSQAVCGVGIASPEEIDEINILQASFLAMRRAIEECALRADMILVDGNRLPKDWPWAAQSVIKGDAKSVSIAAASILAKVTRDRIMSELNSEFPAYGWAENSGYPTPTHLKALDEFGPSCHHRRSFAPVKNFFLKKAS